MFSVEVGLAIDEWHRLTLTYRAMNACGIVKPPIMPSERADGLWSSTCFEMFWRTVGTERYLEFNFSPSTQWAAYDFSGYRAPMGDLQIWYPDIAVEHGDVLQLVAHLELDGFSVGPATLALSAVIEETDGTKSYWALQHPPGPPDFHHPDCFAIKLPPPDAS